MAGLAEVCSHVASILFWLKITTRIRNGQTVTDSDSDWVGLTSPANIIPQKLCDIDFTFPDTEKKQIEDLLSNQPSCVKKPNPNPNPNPNIIKGGCNGRGRNGT